ncbi:hypothetical protein B0H16DRAFT_1584131 [Mycena metata]|uniref:Uncharacterized protein n=1 Tax=Mycena metata TaxID=1033252 RepID=A0AAD7HYI4_9AGAR|nr:hypothetical protein B0H16DRAFT_1584131 [Mycena metata]
MEGKITVDPNPGFCLQRPFKMFFYQLAFISFGVPAALAISIDHTIAPRAPGVFACLDADFTAGCAFFDDVSGKCTNFAAPYNNAISSFSTDEGECTIFVNPDCCGASLGGITPAANLTSLPPGFDNAISSFRCFYDE